MAKRDSKRVIVIDDSHEPDVSTVLAKILELEQQPPRLRKRTRALA